MCGIVGRILTPKSYQRESILLLSEIEELIKKDLINSKESVEVEKILPRLHSLVSRIKSPGLSTAYYCDINSIKRIEEILNQIKAIKHKLNIQYNDTILDIIWIIEIEFYNTHKRILSLIDNEENIENPTLLMFYKSFLNTLDAINFRLESRGRDSAGITIQIVTKHNKRINPVYQYSNGGNIVRATSTRDNFDTHSFTFRVANEIGDLGSNIKDILSFYELHKAEIEEIVLEERVELFSFLSHTRWASVGVVDVWNALPITINAKKIDATISIAMNGDIDNYRSILHDFKDNNLNNDVVQRITSDCSALAKMYNNSKDSKILSPIQKCTGDFVLAVQSSVPEPGIILVNNGLQGLYIGRSTGEISFSSDVYGLVDSCYEYADLVKGHMVSLNRNTLKARKVNTLLYSNAPHKEGHTLTFKPILFSMRDISKKDYTHFYKKEVFDTPIILKKTFQNGLLLTSNNSFAIVNYKAIAEKISNGLITRILFTGMGSCFSAASTVKEYFNKSTPINKHPLTTEAIVASDANAFYNEEDLVNTLVIVFGQSGSTAETNALVKNYKHNGAHIIAIANKHQSQLTFLTDETFYLGDGRDIEISVPATKTFTSHLLAGRLFLYQLERLLCKQTSDIQDSNAIDNAVYQIEQTLNNFEFDIAKKIGVSALKCKNWFVIYDDQMSRCLAEEIRIKLSECCYKVVTVIQAQILKTLKIQGAFIIYICKKKDALPNIINELTKANEFHLITREDAQDLPTPSNKKELAIFQDVINDIKAMIKAQLWVYEIAREMSRVSNGANALYRPIDTIRHQAKTITVGATRECSSLPSHLDNHSSCPTKGLKKEFINTSLNNKINKVVIEVEDTHLILHGEIIQQLLQDKIQHLGIDISVKVLPKIDDFETENSRELPYNNSVVCRILEDNKFDVNFHVDVPHNQNSFNHKVSSWDLFRQKPTETVNLLQTISNKIEDKIFPFPINIEKSTPSTTFKKDLQITAMDRDVVQNLLIREKGIKMLGCLQNINILKLCSMHWAFNTGLSCGVDTLENHKHIDISSEACCIVHIENIFNGHFQNDAFSEIDKLSSHKNSVILVTNLDDERISNSCVSLFSPIEPRCYDGFMHIAQLHELLISRVSRDELIGQKLSPI